jgi:hypothetical protein
MDEYVPKEAKEMVDTSMRSFKVVFIPCDVSLEMVEESILQAPERALSAMIDYAKDRFKRAKLSGKNLQAYQQSIMKEHKDLPATALEQVSDMTLCDVVPLMANKASSNFVSINLVVDDKAVTKQLELNQRASSIAHNCGNDIQVK